MVIILFLLPRLSLGIFCYQISLVLFVNRLKIQGAEKTWGTLITVPAFLHCVLMRGSSGRLSVSNFVRNWFFNISLYPFSVRVCVLVFCVSVSVLLLVAYNTGGMLLCFFDFEIDWRKAEMLEAAAETAITFVFSLCVVACRLW